MKRIDADVFKTQCLKIIARIQRTGESVVITKCAAPVVKVVPVDSHPADLFGFMTGEFKIIGDIGASAVSLKDWNLLKK
ncbi:MAG TPA: hypothetical protein VGR58_12375 [Candidatus Acidoferrum sp.]|nr:hypothetical protein [Candidatus Acidoferrum sp.]